MIIDVHCHLGQLKMFPDRYIDIFATHISHIVSGLSKEAVYQSEIMKKSFDGSPERLIKEMDEAHIDKAVVFGVDWGLALGEPKIPIEEYNKYIAKASQDYSDRLIGFFTIDPRRKNAIELFETAITKWEMRGLKIHPTTGYKLTDEKSRALFKKAIELEVPIVSHLGYITALKGYLAKPRYFDEITTDFPDLKISLAHLNYGEIEDLLNLMFCKTGVYCDFSSHGQILMMNSPPDFYRQLRFFMNFEGVKDRVMFGTDWPMTSNIMSLKDWVATIENLGNEKVSQILNVNGYKRFKKSEITKLLSKNAQNFLKNIL
ncbi:MAG: amidohydrolase family protein [Candidatus Helarchaeota archaeon]